MYITRSDGLAVERVGLSQCWALRCCVLQVNMHFIQKEGHHEEAFAILYYVTYLSVTRPISIMSLTCQSLPISTYVTYLSVTRPISITSLTCQSLPISTYVTYLSVTQPISNMSLTCQSLSQSLLRHLPVSHSANLTCHLPVSHSANIYYVGLLSITQYSGRCRSRSFTFS